MKTDAQIQKDVIAELQWEASVKATDIGVEVSHGIVTLAGHVDTYAEKLAAEKATQRVDGVRGLAVEMDVKLADWGQKTDADLAGAAVKILDWTASVPSESVKVMVESGWVTLQGHVDWQYQRESAEDSVSSLIGLVGITNQIVVKPSASPVMIKAEIQAALVRSATLDSDNIVVSVKDGDVTLSGTVDSWADRASAVYIARGTSGVQHVADNIVVAY